MTSLTWRYRFMYVAIFFAQGAIIPYMALYFSQDRFDMTPGQVGIIVSILPILSIVIQPLWGMLADRTHQKKRWLLVAIAGSVLFVLSFLVVEQYVWIFVLMLVWSLFHCAHIPLADMFTLDFTTKKRVDYGSIRLFGSVGFAVAVFVMGRIGDSEFGLSSTFVASALILAIGGFVLATLPEAKAEGGSEKQSLNWRDLFGNRAFLLFLVAGMLVFGPIYANNYYFGTYVTNIGGTTSLVGMLFLAAVLSEIPFMRMASQWAETFGAVRIMLIAAIVSAVRNLLLALEPALWVVWLLAIAQGLIVGLLIPIAIAFVRKIVQKDVRSTAIALYMALTSGLATALFNLFSGYLIEFFDVLAVFWMYALFSFGGALLFVFLQRER